MNFLKKYDWRLFSFLFALTALNTLLNRVSFLGIDYWGTITALGAIVVYLVLKASNVNM
jgi:hypothetical protein